MHAILNARFELDDKFDVGVLDALCGYVEHMCSWEQSFYSNRGLK